MNRINRNNYESYLIDWMEGNLDAQTEKQVMQFLDENPDIKEEFEKFESVSLEPEPVAFKGKSELKQKIIVPVGGINEDNFENFFIAWHENDLSRKEQESVEQFISKNSFLKKEFEQFGSLKVAPDKAVVYGDKEVLYHRKKAIPLFWISSAAAVLLVLFAIFGLLKNNLNRQIILNHNRSVAQVNTIKTSDSIVEVVKPQTKNLSATSADDSTKKKPSVVQTGNHNKNSRQAIVVKPRKKPRQHAFISELASAQANIKLTSDEVYCKFKYQRHFANESPAKAEKSKSLVGKVLAGLFNDAKTKVSPVVPNNDSNEPLLAKVFDGGARVLNTYTSTEATVTKYYDNRGNLIAYHFSGGQINFNKKFNSRGR